jgi:fatty acyl-CoA reductase
MNDDMIDAITPLIVGRRPNTYTLTKALAEFLIVEECAHLPISYVFAFVYLSFIYYLRIVRPSIIGATCAEPLIGWTDNLNGPTGIFAAVNN